LRAITPSRPDFRSGKQTAESEVARIVSYHAHIYYRTPEERAAAEQVRSQISNSFPVKMGRWHDILIGPHAAPMYQVAFAPEIFPTLVPWLMLNRNNLAILLHPNTGHPRRDHQVHAIWYGEVLPIMNPERLPETSDEDETVTPDTTPF
jgi:DOPA 4,5-dioxygenase